MNPVSLDPPEWPPLTHPSLRGVLPTDSVFAPVHILRFAIGERRPGAGGDPGALCLQCSYPVPMDYLLPKAGHVEHEVLLPVWSAVDPLADEQSRL